MIKKNKFKVGVINKPKKAQITIFIILALAIVLVVLLLFVGRNNLITILGGKEPVEQIKDCITTPLEEAIETQIWMNTFLSSFKEENINKWIKKTDLTIILDEEYVIHNAYIVTERWSLYAVYLHLRDKDKKQRD